LGDKDELDFPLADGDVLHAVHEATDELLTQLVSRTPVVVWGEMLQQVREETIVLYRDTSSVKAFLEEIEQGYPAA